MRLTELSRRGRGAGKTKIFCQFFLKFDSLSNTLGALNPLGIELWTSKGMEGLKSDLGGLNPMVLKGLNTQSLVVWRITVISWQFCNKIGGRS